MVCECKGSTYFWIDKFISAFFYSFLSHGPFYCIFLPLQSHFWLHIADKKFQSMYHIGRFLFLHGTNNPQYAVSTTIDISQILDLLKNAETYYPRFKVHITSIRRSKSLKLQIKLLHHRSNATLYTTKATAQAKKVVYIAVNIAQLQRPVSFLMAISVARHGK